jgi:ABC-type Fe3+-hydroxamate transport system substrate-binding protein
MRYTSGVPAVKVTDDLNRPLVFGAAPLRIVSLVPSDTHTLIALGLTDRIVGRTSYCESPEVAGVTVVGGTKDVDVDAVVALAPQLVIANQEENSRPVLEALAAARVPVFVSLVRTVEAAVAHVARVARICRVEGAPVVKALVARGYAMAGGAVPEASRRAFVPIWMDPLMTLNADTFGSDVLARAGVANVFGDRLRLYPLAADLGKTAPRDAAGRDVRYPRITIEEVVARAPDTIILPDEPHAFSAADEAVFRAALPEAEIIRVVGKELFWYGAWTIGAVARLGDRLRVGLR